MKQIWMIFSLNAFYFTNAYLLYCFMLNTRFFDPLYQRTIRAHKKHVMLFFHLLRQKQRHIFGTREFVCRH